MTSAMTNVCERETISELVPLLSDSFGTHHLDAKCRAKGDRR